MDQNPAEATRPAPLVEIAQDDTVLRALAQSAHPVEFIESNKPGTQAVEAHDGR